jgi:catechol 2,3-dioxygenase-like lactoylglutathione lyase family enzyme
MLELLIRLGADLESPDDKGRTPLMVALLRGDRDAMKLLRAAGAEEPEKPVPPTDAVDGIAAAAAAVLKSEPMFSVADMRATVAWYESVGFTVKDRYEDGGSLMFAKVAFGNAEFALSPGGDPGPRGVSLWFFTDRVHDLYQLFKSRQLDATRPDAPGSKPGLEVRFDEDLYAPFYGGRQFSIRDVNGLPLIFWQPPWLPPGEPS